MLFIIIDILHWGNWVRPFMLNGSNKRYERKKNLTCPWGINLYKTFSLVWGTFPELWCIFICCSYFLCFCQWLFQILKESKFSPLFSVFFFRVERSGTPLWENFDIITHWNRSGGNSRSKMVIMPQKLLLWMRNLLQMARKRLMEKSDDTDGFNRIGSQGDAN